MSFPKSFGDKGGIAIVPVADDGPDRVEAQAIISNQANALRWVVAALRASDEARIRGTDEQYNEANEGVLLTIRELLLAFGVNDAELMPLMNMIGGFEDHRAGLPSKVFKKLPASPVQDRAKGRIAYTDAMARVATVGAVNMLYDLKRIADPRTTRKAAALETVQTLRAALPNREVLDYAFDGRKDVIKSDIEWANTVEKKWRRQVSGNGRGELTETVRVVAESLLGSETPPSHGEYKRRVAMAGWFIMTLIKNPNSDAPLAAELVAAE